MQQELRGKKRSQKKKRLIAEEKEAKRKEVYEAICSRAEGHFSRIPKPEDVFKRELYPETDGDSGSESDIDS